MGLVPVLGASIVEPLYEVIGWLLALYYYPFHNLGIAIILLTCTVMLFLFPFTAKQAKSMIAMQAVQPEIKKIQQKYKDDKQKQNEELLKFYQENKINPLSGCLPLLIQIPIGFALFRAISLGVHRHVPKSGQLSQLYKDLCPTGCPKRSGGGKAIEQSLTFLGMKLNVSAIDAQKAEGLLHALPYFAMVALVVLTGWYQVRQTQARALRQGGAPPNTQMQMITRIMPLMFGFITVNLVAGAVLYFVVSNLWRIGQQQLVLNKIYDQAAANAASKGPSDADPKDGGGGNGGKAPPAKAGSGGVTGNGRTGVGGDADVVRPPPRRKKKKRKR